MGYQIFGEQYLWRWEGVGEAESGVIARKTISNILNRPACRYSLETGPICQVALKAPLHENLPDCSRPQGLAL